MKYLYNCITKIAVFAVLAVPGTILAQDMDQVAEQSFAQSAETTSIESIRQLLIEQLIRLIIAALTAQELDVPETLVATVNNEESQGKEDEAVEEEPLEEYHMVYEDPDDQVVTLGDEFVLGVVEFEPKNGNATLEEMTLRVTNRFALDDQEIDIMIDNNRVDTVTFTADNTDTVVSGIGEFIKKGDQLHVAFVAEATRATHRAGETVSLELVSAGFEGSVTSNTNVTFAETTLSESDSLLVLKMNETNEGLQTENNKELFVLSISAGGADIVVDSITLFLNTANVSLSDLYVAAYENAAHTDPAGTNNESDVHSTPKSFTGNKTFVFADPIIVSEGDTVHFVLESDVTVTDNTRSVRVTLEDEQGTGIVFSQPIGLNNSDGLIDNDIEVLHTE